IHQQFTTAELRAIVEVAGLADRVVAAHCHGKPGIMAALRAGVRTIEHGTFLDDECCDAMRESGAILVPTRTIIEDMLANKAVVPDYAMAKLEAIADTHAQAVTRAYEHGVTIAMGTDIALTGADLHSFPLDWMGDWGRQAGTMRLADGPDDCARATREQLRRNAKVIKVCASGGVLSEVDDPIHQQFTLAELRAIVEVAGLADRVVAAHCHGKPGIMAALRAGVRTIEHGTYLDDEGCDAMRESGAILVPTRTIIEDILANKDGVPDYALVKLEAIADIHAQAVTRAYEHGVTIAMGTDIALTGPDRPNAWGQNGAEPGYLVKLGMTPLEAIEATTATGPFTLGPQAPRSGQLAEGYDADVITLDADPLADIGVLADPARITAVWTAGQQVKGARP
ncbi:MAG TPA: amidohydrolase family protein, partial [Streptosporangiaceae bacterium]|nr:amidohydrolase family protein [Streptosporangiaceae bacterium]